MRTILVVDIGTSSVRTVLTGEDLEIRSMVQRKRTAGICMDAEVEWEFIRSMIKQLSEENREMLEVNPISAVAVSALVGWVGVDCNGGALTPCYTYMHRERRMFEEMAPRIDVNEAFQICGRAPAPEWLAYKLRRLKREQPALYGMIASVISLKDFINMKLCGQTALDHTSAGYTFLYDIRKGGWSEKLLENFQADMDKLPGLRRPWERLGTLKRELAEQFAFSGEIPVVTGSCDGSTAVLGAGGVREKTAVSVMGTTDVFFLVAKQWSCKESRGLIVNPHVIPGYWLIGGPMGMYGGTVDWYMNQIIGERLSLDEMTLLAEQLEPGCSGLTVLPNLAGERAPYWHPESVGTLVGLTREHRAEHIFRGIMEANGYDCREILERAEEMGAECTEIAAIGGGALNSLWLTIKSEITGIPVRKSEVTEATVAGSAMLALYMLDGKLPEGRPHKKEWFEGNVKQREQYRTEYLKFRERRKLVEKLYSI